MVDPTATELNAIVHASNMGGEFLDEIRITDLAKLTTWQYRAYIRVIISAYQGEIDRLRVAAAKDFPIPY